MSLIEPGHLFSQHSLRTYQRCPRRFLLRYIDRQPWPAPNATMLPPIAPSGGGPSVPRVGSARPAGHP